jgi:LPXTG-motif cell wall-anchored protein
MQGSGVYVNKKYDDSYTDIWTETIDRQTLTCLSFVNGSEKIEYLAQKPTRYFISTSIEENQKIPYLCPTSFTMVKEQKLSYMRSESLKLVDCSVKYDNMNIQGNNVQAIVLLNQNEFSDEHTNESYNQIFKFEKTTGLLSSFSVKSSIFAWGVDGSYWERRIEETGAYEVKTISWNISQPSPTPYSTESTPTITTTTKETPTSTPSPSPTQQLIQPTGFDMNTIVLVAIIIIVIAAAAFFITKRKKS